jgi:hypothetical protein
MTPIDPFDFDWLLRADGGGTMEANNIVARRSKGGFVDIMEINANDETG